MKRKITPIGLAFVAAFAVAFGLTERIPGYSFFGGALINSFVFMSVLVVSFDRHRGMGRFVVHLFFTPGLLAWSSAQFIRIFSPAVTQILPSMALVFVCTVVVWIYASIRTDPDLAKVGVGVMNGVFRTFLASLVMLAVFGDSWVPAGLAEIAQASGLKPGALVDYLIKVVSLPYVVAGIWASMTLDIRQYREKRQRGSQSPAA